MKISIVTVCYNSAKTIRDTIESVLSQTYADVEYIIVDGASTDGTIEIVDSYRNQVSKFISEPDHGIYDAMNKGVAAATGDVVGLLNSDDVYEHKDVLTDVVSSFSERSSADIIFGDVVFASPDNMNRVVRYYRSSHFRPWKLRFGWMPPHPATFVRREVYEKYGLYSLNYRIASDYEIFVRWMLLNKLRYHYLDAVLVRMRTNGVSTSGWKSSVVITKEIVRACRDNGVYTNLPLILTKVPFKLMELWRRPVGSGV